MEKTKKKIKTLLHGGWGDPLKALGPQILTRPDRDLWSPNLRSIKTQSLLAPALPICLPQAARREPKPMVWFSWIVDFNLPRPWVRVSFPVFWGEILARKMPRWCRNSQSVERFRWLLSSLGFPIHRRQHRTHPRTPIRALAPTRTRPAMFGSLLGWSAIGVWTANDARSYEIWWAFSGGLCRLRLFSRVICDWFEHFSIRRGIEWDDAKGVRMWLILMFLWILKFFMQ